MRRPTVPRSSVTRPIHCGVAKSPFPARGVRRPPRPTSPTPSRAFVPGCRRSRRSPRLRRSFGNTAAHRPTTATPARGFVAAVPPFWPRSMPSRSRAARLTTPRAPSIVWLRRFITPSKRRPLRPAGAKRASISPTPSRRVLANSITCSPSVWSKPSGRNGFAETFSTGADCCRISAGRASPITCARNTRRFAICSIWRAPASVCRPFSSKGIRSSACRRCRRRPGTWRAPRPDRPPMCRRSPRNSSPAARCHQVWMPNRPHGLV